MSEPSKPKPIPLVALSSVIVCFLAASVTTVLLFKIGDFGDMELGDIPILALPIPPYVILAGVAWRFRETISSSITMLVGTMALSLFGVYVLLDVFVFSTHHTSTEGLIVLFVPVYQMLGILLLTGAAYFARVVSKYLIRRREARKPPTPP